jgi:hypothetical protein
VRVTACNTIPGNFISKYIETAHRNTHSNKAYTTASLGAVDGLKVIISPIINAIIAPHIIPIQIFATQAYNQNIIADKKAIQSKAYDLFTVP